MVINTGSDPSEQAMELGANYFCCAGETFGAALVGEGERDEVEFSSGAHKEAGVVASFGLAPLLFASCRMPAGVTSASVPGTAWASFRATPKSGRPAGLKTQSLTQEGTQIHWALARAAWVGKGAGKGEEGLLRDTGRIKIQPERHLSQGTSHHQRTSTAITHDSSYAY
jgi:hypothetical protein